MAQKRLRKYCLNPIVKENELNRVLEEQKKSKGRIALLYHSEWCPVSNNLRKELLKRYPDYCEDDVGDDAVTIYLISSWDTPHAFVIFNVKQAPTLVQINGDSVTREDYVPNIYHKLGV